MVAHVTAHQLRAGFGRTHAEGLASLGNGITQAAAQRLSVQPDLSGLPEKRAIVLPPASVVDSLRCPPVEEVAKHYHAERAAVLQVGIWQLSSLA